MLPVIDMRRSWPYDVEGRILDPDYSYPIDDDSGDLLLVTFTDQGWMASRHISNPVDGEDDRMYWTLANPNFKEGSVVALLSCGPALMQDVGDAYQDLCFLVEDELTPIAHGQRSPIRMSLLIGGRPVEADYRPSTCDRSLHRTDGTWEDVNGAAGRTMRPTGGTFVVHRRMTDGFVTYVRVVANPDYDADALRKVLASIDE